MGAIGTRDGAAGWLAERGGWVRRLWPVVRQAACDVWANHLMEWAAALAFYALLSLFPLGLAAVAAASWVVEPGWAATRLGALLEGFVPAGVIDVDAIVTAAVTQRGRVGLLAVVAWLIAGRRILGALVTALDQVSDVDARRESWLRRAAVEAVLLAGLGGLFAAALSAGALLDILWNASRADAAWSPLQAVAGAALQVALLVATFFAIYTLVPHGKRDGRAALLGAVAAAVLFLAARAVFLAAIGLLWASFDLIYGPLALGALLLLWAWYVGLVVLFGGSLASHAKTMLVEGRSAAEAERRHVGRKGA